MRLISATLRNYRLHRELTVEFNPERTVIGGPNECGKSTLVEALHRALFLRAKGTGEPHQVMRSFHGGHPEVELHFESGGQRYRVHKRFSGQSGTTTFTRSGGKALSGDEAETELARVLGVACDANAKLSCERWAHLWVWQGQSADDPARHANQQRDTLLQRLGERGGAAAIMQSETDARLAKTFAEACAATFKQGDKARADSELARIEAEVAFASEEHTSAAARLEKLRQALQDFTQASSALEATQKDLVNLRHESERAEAKARRLAELMRTEAAHATDAQTSDAAETELQRIELQIAQLRTKIDRDAADIAPLKAEETRLTDASEAARAEAEALFKAYDLASSEVRQARQQHELAATQLTLFAHRLRRDELEARAQQARKVVASLDALQRELAKIPALEAADVKRLEKLAAERADAEVALQAMAAGIEVLASDQPVRLGETPLAAGVQHIVTEDAQIAIGANVRLRIRPGGGTNLAEARRRMQDAQAKLTKQLDNFGLSSVAIASEIAAQRAALVHRIEAETTRLRDLDAAEIEQKLKLAQDDCLATEADGARRSAALGLPPDLPVDEAHGRAAHQAAAERLQHSEGAEKRARIQRDTAAKRSEEAASALARSRASSEQQSRALLDLQAQLRLLLSTHGEDNARSERLAQALKQKAAAQNALATVRGGIAAEQPEHLGPTQNRLKRALEDVQRRQQEAEQKKAVAEHTLRSDGSMNPEADLAIAQGRLAAAQDRFVSVRRRAQAIRLLDELFRAEQQVLAEQFTRPLVETASAYLQALYGRGTRLEVTFDQGEFSQPQLIRPQIAGGAALRFEQLSGGTKEQVAVAMRLAMAEVLAANHEGNLPLVLDDAFVNADPERVLLLQRMLDLGATRGLQVIVVTCTPSDYATLGAHQIRLSPAA